MKTLDNCRVRERFGKYHVILYNKVTRYRRWFRAYVSIWKWEKVQYRIYLNEV